MKIKWVENPGTRAFSHHGPETDFSAKYDPETLYDVLPETAARLLKSGLFETAAETTRRRKPPKEENDFEIEDSKNKENE